MHRLRGSAADLHARAWPIPPVPSVWVLDVDRPALVLGSTQPDVAATGIEVARRRSGGGAVLVAPTTLLWADVLLPSGDALWDADVGRAFGWLGRVWADALAAAGVAGATVHDGPLVHTPWSDRVCFAGLGPGEVTVDGRKVVGISQRRTREAALFQCAALLEWDAAGTAALLDVPAEELEPLAAAVPVSRAQLEAAFLRSMAEV